NAVSYQYFHATLKQFWAFLHSHPILLGIRDEMLRRHTSLESHVETQLASSEDVITCDDECENAAFAYLLLKRCVESQDQSIEMNLGFRFHATDGDAALDTFRNAFVDPLYEYLDEQIDDQRAILATLRRYKHKCESFQRRHLYDLWKSDTS